MCAARRKVEKKSHVRTARETVSRKITVRGGEKREEATTLDKGVRAKKGLDEGEKDPRREERQSDTGSVVLRAGVITVSVFSGVNSCIWP